MKGTSTLRNRELTRSLGEQAADLRKLYDELTRGLKEVDRLTKAVAADTHNSAALSTQKTSIYNKLAEIRNNILRLQAMLPFTLARSAEYMSALERGDYARVCELSGYYIEQQEQAVS